MEFKLRPASRGELWSRLLLFAESGHGKTYTALAVAFHLADLYGYSPDEIAVLDTEIVESADRVDRATGSAEKYSGRPCNCNRCHRQGLVFDGFQTMLMETDHRGPEAFQRALEVCKQAGIKIVLLDGITDEWRALLRIVDKVKAETRNREDGWSTARPLHNEFERAVMEFPGHVIATCRAKRESRHKKAEEGPADVIPDQDGNVVYRYDVALYLKRGTGYVAKTRDDRMEDVSSRHPGADLAEALKRWCDDPKAQSKSAVGEHVSKADPLPETAPNTRTDAQRGPDPTPADRQGQDRSGRSASGAPGNDRERSSRTNSTPAATELGSRTLAMLCAKVEQSAVELKRLGKPEIAEQSIEHMRKCRNAKDSALVREALDKLIVRQQAVIDERKDQIEREAVAASNADPDEGLAAPF